MRITRGQLGRIIREEAQRLQKTVKGRRQPMMERGRDDFSDMADRTETYDQLVDMFVSAMDDTGEDFDGLVAMLRDDVSA